MTDADRLTRLEEALTHQAAMLDDLSETVRRQAETLDRLERLVTLLRRRAAEEEADRGGTVFNDVPPHY